MSKLQDIKKLLDEGKITAFNLYRCLEDYEVCLHREDDKPFISVTDTDCERAIGEAIDNLEHTLREDKRLNTIVKKELLRSFRL